MPANAGPAPYGEGDGIICGIREKVEGIRPQANGTGVEIVTSLLADPERCPENAAIAIAGLRDGAFVIAAIYALTVRRRSRGFQKPVIGQREQMPSNPHKGQKPATDN